MKRKIIKYLKSKDENEYGHLDRVFVSYISGRLEQILNNYGFLKIEIFPEIRRKSENNNIQIYFRYYNLMAIIDFYDLFCVYGIHIPYESYTSIDENTLQVNYGNEFSIDKFINDIFYIMDTDSRLDKKYKWNDC